MKVRLMMLLGAIFLVDIVSAHGGPRIVNDPVADYIERHASDLRPIEERNECVLKFEIDVDNDGKVDVFLSSEKSSLLSKEYENAVRTWDLYKSIGDGNYFVTDQEKSAANSKVYYHPSEFIFDPQKIYVGPVNEIGGYGLLAMFCLHKKNEVQIAVYILGDGYFENKKFPNPTASEAGIYHRDDSGQIPDLPQGYRHYFATPPTQTIKVLSQRF